MRVLSRCVFLFACLFVHLFVVCFFLSLFICLCMSVFGTSPSSIHQCAVMIRVKLFVTCVIVLSLFLPE